MSKFTPAKILTTNVDGVWHHQDFLQQASGGVKSAEKTLDAFVTLTKNEAT